MSNPVISFVKQVTERASKTAAQAALLELGAENAGHLNALSVHWLPVGGFALGGFILSVLTSLASAPAGDKTSPSLVAGPALTVPVDLPAPVAPVGG